MMKQGIFDFISRFFAGYVGLGELNHTLLVLIPKVKNVSSMLDFRPISLCNMVYKLISKILSNKLKQVLSTIIDSSQSTFLPGWLITDNAIIAFECFHNLHNWHQSSMGDMAVKLDIQKAYDRLE